MPVSLFLSPLHVKTMRTWISFRSLVGIASLLNGRKSRELWWRFFIQCNVISCKDMRTALELTVLKNLEKTVNTVALTEGNIWTINAMPATGITVFAWRPPIGAQVMIIQISEDPQNCCISCLLVADSHNDKEEPPQLFMHSVPISAKNKNFVHLPMPQQQLISAPSSLSLFLVTSKTKQPWLPPVYEHFMYVIYDLKLKEGVFSNRKIMGYSIRKFRISGLPNLSLIPGSKFQLWTVLM